MTLCTIGYFDSESEPTSLAATSLFYGTLISTCLLGFTLSHGLMYYKRNADGRAVRTWVYLMILLDVLTGVTAILAAGNVLLESTPTADRKIRFEISLGVLSAITVSMAFLSQAFMLQRLYQLKPNFRLFIVICLCIAVISLVLGSASLALMSRLSTTQDHMRTASWYYTNGLAQALAAIVDLVVTAGFSYTLVYLKHDSMRKQTKSTLNYLLFFIMNRGLLLSVCQALYAVLWLTNPVNPRYTIVYFALSKLYTNSMLVILNAREGLRSKMESATILTAPTLRRVQSRDVYGFSTIRFTVSEEPEQVYAANLDAKNEQKA